MTKPEEIQKALTTRSERVKMVDMHPKEPLVLCALYSGQVTLWNYETKSMVKSFEIIDLPVRCVKFITRLQSFACGADDMNVRIFNYNTMEKTKTFQAHEDYIRGLAVHDQLPLLLTCSDDMTIKQWDWSKGWQHTMTFEGHAHYVMTVVFNPKDPTTFATASLDQTVKVWSITTPVPNFSLEGHEEGVNCVEYYHGGDKPYLISGSDDRTVRVWDYQTKACIQVLSHHTNNVTCVFFHPDVPLLFTSGEDETVAVYSTQTWRQETTLNYGLQRGWSFASKPGSNALAIAFDKGMVVIKVGKEEPVMSMDQNGKILIAVGNDITRMDVKGIAEKEIADGEPIPHPPYSLTLRRFKTTTPAHTHTPNKNQPCPSPLPTSARSSSRSLFPLSESSWNAAVRPTSGSTSSSPSSVTSRVSFTPSTSSSSTRRLALAPPPQG